MLDKQELWSAGGRQKRTHNFDPPAPVCRRDLVDRECICQRRAHAERLNCMEGKLYEAPEFRAARTTNNLTEIPRVGALTKSNHPGRLMCLGGKYFRNLNQTNVSMVAVGCASRWSQFLSGVIAIGYNYMSYGINKQLMLW